MIPVIMNLQFEKLGMIDEFKSFIWTTRYYSTGDFEIVTGVNKKSTDILKRDYYVMRDDDPEYIGIIESVEADVSEEAEFSLIAKGRFLSSILGRRIIADQTQIKGLLSSGIYDLINDAAINPVITKRKIPNLILGDYAGTATVDAQITGKNLLTTISDLCEKAGIGFKTSLTAEHNFKFELYEGIDRSYDQSVNSYAVFSDRFENLLNSQYIEDASKMVTNVLVAGEGEGTDRKRVWVTNDDDPSGIDRYELYTDARSIRTNNGEISDAEYYAQLAEDGKTELTSYTKAFTGTVDFNNIRYKQDVFMGDICSIENSALGMYVNARLVEVIESIDESGKYTIIPTFGL